MGARNGDEREGAEILNVRHPSNVVGARKYDVSIVIEKFVAMAQNTVDSEQDFVMLQ